MHSEVQQTILCKTELMLVDQVWKADRTDLVSSPSSSNYLLSVKGAANSDIFNVIILLVKPMFGTRMARRSSAAEKLTPPQRLGKMEFANAKSY